MRRAATFRLIFPFLKIVRASSRRLLRFARLAFAAIPLITFAQQNTPRIGYVFPAGGKVGSSFQVTVGGQFLDGVTNVFFSGDHVRATVIEHTKPITQGQFNQLRDAARELQEKKRLTLKNNKRDSQNS